MNASELALPKCIAILSIDKCGYKEMKGVGEGGGWACSNVCTLYFHIYVLCMFVKTFYSAPAAKVSISAIVKFLHAQQIKMSTHAHTRTPMGKLSHDTCNVNDQRQLLLSCLPLSLSPSPPSRLEQTQINNDVCKMKCPA